MKELNRNETLMIIGGAAITGTLINSMAKAVSTLLDLGRALGSAVRRVQDGKSCPI